MRILWSAPADFLELESWDWPGELVIGPPAKHLGVEVWVVDPIQRVIPRQIRRYPKLRLMVTPSTGTDHLPLDYMLKKGIEWRSLLDDRTALEDIRASSEFTFLLLLAVLRNFPVGYLQLKSKRRRDESVFRGNELFQKRIGIIGLGRIGRNIRDWCRAFGCDVQWHDYYLNWSVPLDHLFETSDVIVVSCSLNPESAGMIDKDLLSSMKEGAVLVSISRAGVINETDLRKVLLSRPDIRVGIDVLGGDSTDRNLLSPLLDYRQVLATPHMGGAAVEANLKAAKIAHDLIAEWSKEREDKTLLEG